MRLDIKTFFAVWNQMRRSSASNTERKSKVNSHKPYLRFRGIFPAAVSFNRRSYSGVEPGRTAHWHSGSPEFEPVKKVVMTRRPFSLRNKKKKKKVDKSSLWLPKVRHVEDSDDQWNISL